jgi:hypothetical protein
MNIVARLQGKRRRQLPHPGGEGTVAVRTDQPWAVDGVPTRESLSEPTGDRDELRQRLLRLPPGHPSSPAEQDGKAREADWRLSDAEHAEHVTEVRALLDKARADGLATDRQHTIDPAREVWSDQRDALHDSIIRLVIRGSRASSSIYRWSSA